MNIEKVEDKWNAEKFKERQNSYGLTYKVSMETEREPSERSQGKQGGQEKYESQQNNSQDRTKIMGANHVQQSISTPTHAHSEPRDPANRVEEPTHDPAGEAATQ